MIFSLKILRRPGSMAITTSGGQCGPMELLSVFAAVAICSGMHVAATDGKVGKLDELVLDPDSGDITHLLMRKGRLWGKRDVAVPASAVDYVEADTVHRNVDRAAVKAMPKLSVRRPTG